MHTNSSYQKRHEIYNNNFDSISQDIKQKYQKGTKGYLDIESNFQNQVVLKNKTCNLSESTKSETDFGSIAQSTMCGLTETDRQLNNKDIDGYSRDNNCDVDSHQIKKSQNQTSKENLDLANKNEAYKQHNNTTMNTIESEGESPQKLNSFCDHDQNISDMVLNLDEDETKIDNNNDMLDTNNNKLNITKEQMKIIAKALKLIKYEDSKTLNKNNNKDMIDSAKAIIRKKPIKFNHKTNELKNHELFDNEIQNKLILKLDRIKAKQSQNNDNKLEQKEQVLIKSKGSMLKQNSNNIQKNIMNNGGLIGNPQNNIDPNKKFITPVKKSNNINGCIEQTTFILDEIEDSYGIITSTERSNRGGGTDSKDKENLKQELKLKHNKECLTNIKHIDTLSIKKDIFKTPVNKKPNVKFYDELLQQRTVPTLGNSHMSNSFIDVANDLNSDNKMFESYTTPKGKSSLKKEHSKSLTKSRDISPRQADFQFRPHLSKKSLSIASKLGDSFHRLISTPTSERSKNKLIEELNSELTFKPNINKISGKLDARFKEKTFNGDELHRWDQLFLLHHKTMISKSVKKIQSEKKELEEETQYNYKPSLCKSSYEITRDIHSDIFERSYKWQKRKEDKLNKERVINTEKELDGCTFNPIMSKDSFTTEDRGKHSNSINSFKELTLMIKGVENHFERIDLAKRKEQEKIALRNRITGQRWEHKITMPQEFRFRTNKSSINLSQSPIAKISKNMVFYADNLNKSVNSIFGNSKRQGKDDETQNFCDFNQLMGHLHSELHKIPL